jgi:ribosome-binding ATPase YchF (GTP1/OBG family)
MATPSKRKPPAKLKLTPASTLGAPRDDSESDDSDPSDDDELSEFLASPPTAADVLHVVAASASGDAIVQTRQRKEVLADVDAIAERITKACERWASSERRLVRFRASWQRGERILATHAFEYGEAVSNAPVLDGSAQSFLVQMQHAQLERDKLFIESLEAVQRQNEISTDSWKSLLNIANKRNEALEHENDKLRERLRKSDDVGNEIAIESARAEIEARGRTADLLEKRLLPIAQAFVAQKLQESAATLAGTTGEHEHSQQEEPSTKP